MKRDWADPDTFTYIREYTAWLRIGDGRSIEKENRTFWRTFITKLGAFYIDGKRSLLQHRPTGLEAAANVSSLLFSLDKSVDLGVLASQ